MKLIKGTDNKDDGYSAFEATNIDRTFNNTNLLWWHRELWVIDNLETHKQIARGNPRCGPIARLDIPGRFRWLTAVRAALLSRRHARTPGKPVIWMKLLTDCLRNWLNNGFPTFCQLGE